MISEIKNTDYVGITKLSSLVVVIDLLMTRFPLGVVIVLGISEDMTAVLLEENAGPIE